ncbi:MAG: aspartyl protease family protein [Chloroflexota bacterium]
MTRTYTYDYDNLRYFPSAPVLDLHIFSPDMVENVQTVTAMVDTGSDTTVLPIKILEEIGAQMTRMVTLRGIYDGRHSNRLYRVAVRIGDYTINKVEVASSANPNHVVVGRDVVNHLVMTLDGPVGVTSITSE